MSWRRRARVPAVLVMAGGLALSWTAGAHASPAIEATGWWWAPNTSTVPLEVPKRADVADDQLLVEGEPNGATAVAAVRIKVPSGETSPILTVTPTQDSVVPDDAAVLACRASSSWAPAKGGKWEAKPIPDCFTSVQGIKGTDGKLVFAVAPLQSDDVVDVMLVPGTVPSAPDSAKGSVFSLKFAAPTAADVKTTAAEEGGFTSTGGDFASPDPSAFGADSAGSGDSSSSTFSGAGSTSFDSGSSFDGGSVSLPSPAFSQPSTFSAPTTVPPSAPSAGVAAPVAAAPLQATPASNTADTKRGRTFGIIVLLAGGALGFWAYTGSAGGVEATPDVAGLGRFARPRQGPPPPLG